MRRVPRFVLMVACPLSVAVAQNKPLLDLSAAPTAPPAGSGAGALALADSLASQADQIDKAGGEHAGAELRRLAAELLATGEKSGQAGSARVVLGRTLAGSIPTIDSVIARADPASLALATDDLITGQKALNTGNPDPDLILRDALATLARLAGPAPARAGWIDAIPSSAPEPLSGRLEAWAKCPGVTPEALTTLKDLDSLASAADAWPSYRPSAARFRALVIDAAAAFDSPPAWLTEPSRRILAEQFSTAVKQYASRDTRDQGLDGLLRLAQLSDLIRRTDALEDSAAGKKVRAGIAQTVAIPPAQLDARTLDSFSRLMTLAAARTTWPEERSFIRQIRPVWKIIAAQARPTEQQVLNALPEILKRPEAMTDPGTLAAITAHKRVVADAQGLIAINIAFAAPHDAAAEPVVAEPWKHAAERLLKLSQELNRPDQREAAQTTLRALITHVSTVWHLPGEDDLRQAARADAAKPPAERKSPWSRLTADHATALLSELTDRRAGWINAWQKIDRVSVTGTDGERLTVLRSLISIIQDAGPLVDAEPGLPSHEYAALQQWPGWELSWTSLTTLTSGPGGLIDQVSEASRLALAGDTAKAADALAKIRHDFAIPLLAGRLAHEAQLRGLITVNTPGAAVLELASGGPIRSRSWMGQYTDELDDVCRYTEEAIAQRKLGAKDKADSILKFATLRAATVLDALDAAK